MLVLARALIALVSVMTLVGSNIASVTLTTSWQLVSLTYTAVNPGSSNIDYQAYITTAAVGTGFYADDASITLS